MRTLARIAGLGLFLGLLAAPASGIAQLASIETMAPLEDHSDEAVEKAVKQAVGAAVRGALAMGLPWVRLERAVVHESMVTVHLLATAQDPDESDAAPDAEGLPGTGAGAGEAPKIQI